MSLFISFQQPPPQRHIPHLPPLDLLLSKSIRCNNSSLLHFEVFHASQQAIDLAVFCLRVGQV